MKFFKNVKEKIKRFFRRLIKLQVVTITQRDLGSINKAIEKDRGFARGELLREKALRQKLEQLIKKQREINVNKQLYEQARKLFTRQYQGSLSWRRLINIAKRKKIYVTSYNFKRVFGRFYDILTLKDGRIAITTITKKGKIRPVITGRSMKDMLKYYGGLVYSAGMGFLVVNLDEHGRYVPNLEASEVPNVVIDSNGKINYLDYNTDEFITLLAEKQATISELISQMESLQQALYLENLKRRISEMKYNLERGKLTSILGGLSQSLQETKDIMTHFRQISEEASANEHARKILESEVKALEEKRDEILKKQAEKFPKTAIEVAKDEFKENVEWGIDNIAEPIVSAVEGMKKQLEQKQKREEHLIPPPPKKEA